jgi:hypothetical protein
MILCLVKHRDIFSPLPRSVLFSILIIKLTFSYRDLMLFSKSAAKL